MKFLCVRCDEPMKLQSAGPDAAGSITALYACPTCAHQIAMLTNAYETQLVQSLGVKIGPGGGEPAAESRCPFAGMIREAPAVTSDLAWTPGAEARLANIPEFVRPMARQGIEHYARSNGHTLIDDTVMDEARSRFGM